MSTFKRNDLKKARRRFAYIRRKAEKKILKAKEQRGKDCLKAALAATSVEELAAIYELTLDGMSARRAILNRMAGLCATPSELRGALEGLPRNMIGPVNPIQRKWERLCLKLLPKADTSDKVIDFLLTCPTDSVQLRNAIGAAWRQMAVYQALAKLLGFFNDPEAICGVKMKLILAGIREFAVYDDDYFATLCRERLAALQSETPAPTP